MAVQPTVTLDDVAQSAGVSPKTVSRVLNNEANVRAETRARVLEAAKRLGYRPNPAARSLAGSRSYLIAHIHDNPFEDYVARANAGIYRACRAHGYLLLPEPIELSAGNAAQHIDAFLNTARVDGVVLTPPVCDDQDIVALLNARDMPFALISPMAEHASRSSTRIDEQAAASQMVKHLIDLGHRRIGFIAGPANHGSASERRHGFLATITSAGLDPATCPIEDGDFSMRSGVMGAERLLARSERPTAIFAANDSMAAGAMTAAYKAGLSIPGDVSIAGFDAAQIGAALWPPLTTVRQPVTMMAERAASWLMGADTGEAAHHEAFETELVIRESTGPAPS